MKIANVRHRKDGSGWVHAFVRRGRKWMVAACKATQTPYPIREPNLDGPWCDKCDTSLARMELGEKPERQVTAQPKQDDPVKQDDP